jgi:phospholipid transport system substrate-binding protein
MKQVHGFSARHVRRLPALVAVVATFILGTLPALAQDAPPGAPTRPPISQQGPLDLVQSCVSRAREIVQSQPDGEQRRAEIRELAAMLFDFNEMTRRTLAQHWTERSPQEQEEFVRLFAGLLERAYLSRIGNYRLATVTFQGESVEGSTARVRSRLVTERGVETPMEYRLLGTGGRWAVYDVVVEGVSLLSSYRSQFNSILRTSSFDMLLDRLRSREAPLTPARSEAP